MNQPRRRIVLFLFLAGLLGVGPKISAAKSDDPPAAEATPQTTPLSTPVAGQNKTAKDQPIGKILFLHKPMPSPSWGRVIQYHRDQILALSEKNRETIHEFLFQDDAGVIRTATFHENASGEGYWEVWIWDQP